MEGDAQQTTAGAAAPADSIRHDALSPSRRVPAPETVRLYATDWAAFVTWCRAAGVAPLPATVATVAAYLAALEKRLSAGALARRVAAIAAQHRQHEHASPAADRAVTTILRTAR